MAGFADSKLSDEVTSGVVRGDMDAIAQAYETLSQPVMNLSARILSDRALAEEVVQDTFIELVEKSGQIREAGAVVGWVKRVAVNHCLMRLRSPWHARRSSQEADEILESSAPEFGENLDWVAQVPTMEQALSNLASETRAVIWLHDVEGYTHKEIGQLMGKTPSFSKSQLARGYEKLQIWARHPARREAGSHEDERVTPDLEVKEYGNGQKTIGNFSTSCAP